MPLKIIALQNFNQLDEKNKHLKTQILELYQHSPEFETNIDTLSILQRYLSLNGVLYIGLLKDNVIVAVASLDDGQTNSRCLQHIVVHPNYRRRGIAQKFIKQAIDCERKKGVCHFLAGDNFIHWFLAKYELFY